MDATTAQLLQEHCRHTTDALPPDQAAVLLQAVEGWRLDGARIVREFGFKDYHRTLDFVNAIAVVIHAEDHHPELTVTYNRCVVRFDTHSVDGGRGGLSRNDFICAAKVDAIYRTAFA